MDMLELSRKKNVYTKIRIRNSQVKVDFKIVNVSICFVIFVAIAFPDIILSERQGSGSHNTFTSFYFFVAVEK